MLVKQHLMCLNLKFHLNLDLKKNNLKIVMTVEMELNFFQTKQRLILFQPFYRRLSLGMHKWCHMQ